MKLIVCVHKHEPFIDGVMKTKIKFKGLEKRQQQQQR